MRAKRLSGSHWRKVCWVIVSLLLSANVLGFQIPSGTPPPPPPPPEAGQREDAVKLSAEMVLVSFTVSDKQGSSVLDLSKKEVKIFENGREQEISYFLPAQLNLQQDNPALVMVLLDQSRSVRSLYVRDAEAAAQFTDALPPNALVAVAHFGVNLILRQTFTFDREAIKRAFVTTAGVETSNVFQAVVTAIEMLNRIPPMALNRPNRKVLIVISDGLATGQGVEVETAVNYANASAVKIFALQVASASTESALPADRSGRSDDEPTGFGSGGDDFDFGRYRGGGGGTDATTRRSFSAGRFERLAGDTGGLYFSSARSANGLGPILKSVAWQIRNEYVVGYQPKTQPSDGKWRRIDVKILRKGVTIRGARKGYLPTIQSKDQ